MALTFKPDLARVKVNEQAKHQSWKSFPSKVIVLTLTHTALTGLRGALKRKVNMTR